MKKIDSRFPVFAQLEVGDMIYIINVNEKVITGYRILSTTDTSIEYTINSRFNCNTKSKMLSSYFIDENGVGWATSREAAIEGVYNFLDTKIDMVDKTIAAHEEQIKKLQCQKETLANLKKQF